MIVTENNKPSIEEFKILMKKTDALLNREATEKEDYYSKRNGSLLENDVYEALCRCSEKTPFENTILLVSGKSFPDIVANKYYGVEVKSTNKNKWQSIGSSILESTRIEDVERIFLTFGKLAKPVMFMSRPYEECLSDIYVTHYPRYHIDMKLPKGKTIFDKIGIEYDELRQMDNPVKPVSKYYKSLLKPGQSLWWSSEDDLEETSAPPILRLWTSLTATEKNDCTVHGYALFPEILGASATKYQRFALWLAKDKSIINTNIRDQFSSGGKVTINTANGIYKSMPAAFGRIADNHMLIEDIITNTNPKTLCECWQVDSVFENRVEQWCQCVANQTKNKSLIYEMLCDIFDL